MCVFFLLVQRIINFFFISFHPRNITMIIQILFWREKITRVFTYTHTHQSYRYFRFGYSSYFFSGKKIAIFVCVCMFQLPLFYKPNIRDWFPYLIIISNIWNKTKQNRKKVIKFSSSTSKKKKKNDNFTTINGLMIKYQSVVVVVVVVVVVKKKFPYQNKQIIST